MRNPRDVDPSTYVMPPPSSTEIFVVPHIAPPEQQSITVVEVEERKERVRVSEVFS
jgi:hypothetical protein